MDTRYSNGCWNDYKKSKSHGNGNGDGIEIINGDDDFSNACPNFFFLFLLNDQFS